MGSWGLYFVLLGQRNLFSQNPSFQELTPGEKSFNIYKTFCIFCISTNLERAAVENQVGSDGTNNRGNPYKRHLAFHSLCGVGRDVGIKLAWHRALHTAT